MDHRFVVTFALLSALTVIGCASRVQPMQGPEEFPVTTGTGKPVAVDKMREAITAAGVRRGWVFKDGGPGKLLAPYGRRGDQEATVEIAYPAENVAIKYVSSNGLREASVGGHQEIHRNYNRWVRSLKDDIRAELSRY